MAKVTYNSPVILTMMFICLLSLLLGILSGGSTTSHFFTLYATSWLDPMQYLRMFTYIFGHANNAHFINNILILLIIGPLIEEKYKARKLILMILITTILSALLQLFLFRNEGLLGISGIVFMLIILSSFVNVKKGTIPLTFILVLLLYLGNELYQSFVVNDNISHFAHIIGGSFGGLFGFYNNKL